MPNISRVPGVPIFGVLGPMNSSSLAPDTTGGPIFDGFYDTGSNQGNGVAAVAAVIETNPVATGQYQIANDWVMAVANDNSAWIQAGWMQYGQDASACSNSGTSPNVVYPFAQFIAGKKIVATPCLTNYPLANGTGYEYFVGNSGGTSWNALIYYDSVWVSIYGGGIDIGLSPSTANPQDAIEFHPDISNGQYSWPVLQPGYTFELNPIFVWYANGAANFWTPQAEPNTGQTQNFVSYNMTINISYYSWQVTHK